MKPDEVDPLYVSEFKMINLGKKCYTKSDVDFAEAALIGKLKPWLNVLHNPNPITLPSKYKNPFRIVSEYKLDNFLDIMDDLFR